MIHLDLYIKNLNTYNEIENRINSYQSDFVQQIVHDSEIKKEIKLQNDEIIQELKKLDHTILKDDERDNLKKHAEILFDFSTQLDTTVAYIIYQILYHDAILRKNLEDIIDSNYSCGLCYFYLTHNLSGIIQNEYFEHSNDFLPYFNQVSVLSKRHIISSYGNRIMPYINKDHVKVFKLTKEFLQFLDSIETNLQESIDLNVYRIGVYRNLATTLIGYEHNLISHEDFLFVYDCILKM